MRLVNSGTGADVALGTMLHVVSGPSLNAAWRYEAIAPRSEGDHLVRVSRIHPRMGRVHTHMHPKVLGCHIVVDLVWHERCRLVLHHAWLKGDDYLMAGFVALLPLAIFERFHMADMLTAWFAGRGGQ